MRKTLIYQCLVAICIFTFLLFNNNKFQAFLLTSEPTVISKGTFGQSMLIEISYSHKELSDWITALQGKQVLYLLEYDWMMRSDELIKLLQQQNERTGLLLHDDIDAKDLPHYIESYTKVFKEKPIWAACMPMTCSKELTALLFDHEINTLSPSIYLEKETTPSFEKGDIISYRIERGVPLSKNVLDTLTRKNFISIEENILGFTTQTKRYPNP